MGAKAPTETIITYFNLKVKKGMVKMKILEIIVDVVSIIFYAGAVIYMVRGMKK